eukprot:466748_1
MSPKGPNRSKQPQLYNSCKSPTICPVSSRLLPSQARMSDCNDNPIVPPPPPPARPSGLGQVIHCDTVANFTGDIPEEAQSSQQSTCPHSFRRQRKNDLVIQQCVRCKLIIDRPSNSNSRSESMVRASERSPPLDSAMSDSSDSGSPGEIIPESRRRRKGPLSTGERAAKRARTSRFTADRLKICVEAAGGAQLAPLRSPVNVGGQLVRPLMMNYHAMTRQSGVPGSVRQNDVPARITLPMFSPFVANPVTRTAGVTVMAGVTRTTGVTGAAGVTRTAGVTGTTGVTGAAGGMAPPPFLVGPPLNLTPPSSGSQGKTTQPFIRVDSRTGRIVHANRTPGQPISLAPEALRQLGLQTYIPAMQQARSFGGEGSGIRPGSPVIPKLPAVARPYFLLLQNPSFNPVRPNPVPEQHTLQIPTQSTSVGIRPLPVRQAKKTTVSLRSTIPGVMPPVCTVPIATLPSETIPTPSSPAGPLDYGVSRLFQSTVAKLSQPEVVAISSSSSPCGTPAVQPKSINRPKQLSVSDANLFDSPTENAKSVSSKTCTEYKSPSSDSLYMASDSDMYSFDGGEAPRVVDGSKPMEVSPKSVSSTTKSEQREVSVSSESKYDLRKRMRPSPPTEIYPSFFEASDSDSESASESSSSAATVEVDSGEGGDAKRRRIEGDEDVVMQAADAISDLGVSQRPKNNDFFEEEAISRPEFDSSDHDSYISQIRRAQVFEPTMEEFSDALSYIQRIVPKFSRDGICVVRPPKVWLAGHRPRMPTGRLLKMRPQRLTDRIIDSDGLTSASVSVDEPIMVPLETFRNVAAKLDYTTDEKADPDYDPEFWRERQYWRWFRAKHNRLNQAFYGNDIEGSAFGIPNENSKLDQSCSTTSDWNLNILPLRSLLGALGPGVNGVTSPMLYIGMKHSTFTWHFEDNKSYSASFHHVGASRTWYGVSDSSARMFENVVRDVVFENFETKQTADKLIMGKTTMFSPAYLFKHGVGVVKLTQRPGDFVITLPGAYHCGFSHGFNVCEASNFALPDWIPTLHKTTQLFRKLGKPCVLQEEKTCIFGSLLCEVLVNLRQPILSALF